VNNKINRCLKVDGSKVNVFVGNGSSGFSIATKLPQCQLNSPTGVCCYKDDVFISDTKNNCIRKVSKDGKIKTIIGCPETDGDISSPSKMIIRKNMIYFIDDNNIKYASIGGKDIGSIYKSEDKIVSLDIGDDRYLYVLSEGKDAI
ncbi:unnamed protein product, partial [marine sediment metagenome]